VRPPAADQVAGGVDADVMTGHGGDRRGKDGRRRQRPGHHIGPQYPPPAPCRQPAAREQQDHHREQQQRRCPQRREQHGDRGQRQAIVTEPVVQGGIPAGNAAQQEQQDKSDQDPADRIARLAAGHDDAHRRVDHRDGDNRPLAQDRQLTGQGAQHQRASQQYQRQDGQHRRRHRRGQPQTARGQFRPACRLCPHHGRQRYARTVPGTLPLGINPTRPGQTSPHRLVSSALPLAYARRAASPDVRLT
jgi:hypothetical protein